MTYMPNRRSFLIAGGLTALAATRAFGANDRLRIGVIGAGGRMRQLLNSAENTGVPFEIASVCDVYTPRRDEVKTRPTATTATTCRGLQQRAGRQEHRCRDHRDPGPLACSHRGSGAGRGQRCVPGEAGDAYPRRGRDAREERSIKPADPAVRNAAEELAPLPQRGRPHPGRRARAGNTGAHILVAELRLELGAEAGRCGAA